MSLQQSLNRIAPRQAWHLPGRPWLSLQRLVSLVYYRLKRRFGHDYSFSPPSRSSVELALFMPALEKDADMLELALQSAKANIWHPIRRIYIIGPAKSQRLRKIAEQHDAEFIEEEGLVGIKKSDINYQVGNLDRNGWIYKMLVNLSADTICESRYILILDADTCFIGPQIFLYRGRPLFNLSNEYHQSYFDANQRLLGLKHSLSRSYITHYMLFDAKVLKKLRTDIEKRWNKPWYQAIIDIIDKKEASGFADYECYGDYYHAHVKPRPIYNYWSNDSMTMDSFDQFENIVQTKRPYFRSVSLHNYRAAVSSSPRQP